MSDRESIAIVGGTGKLGREFARALARAGCKVTIGSSERSLPFADQPGLRAGLGRVRADAAYE